MTTICLNMIVKNEERVLGRCLSSVKHLIDYYVIVDTGSTDKTKEVIAKELEGIPGEVHERPWVNFGHNRTEAIKLAVGKADYLMVVDADDEIVGEKPSGLTADVYHLKVEDGEVRYDRGQIFKSDESFYYQGILHEFLTSSKPIVNAFLVGLRYIRHGDGSTWGKRDAAAIKAKFKRDAFTLMNALVEEPDNARYVFYLAQSWRDAGELEASIKEYERVATMKGWEEERWFSLYQAACLRQSLAQPQPIVIDAYLRAYEFRPSRLESMWALGRYLQTIGRFRTCYHLLKPFVTSSVQMTTDRLYVDPQVYTWKLADVFADSAYYSGDVGLAYQINMRLVDHPGIPPEIRTRIKNNIAALNPATMSKLFPNQNPSGPAAVKG